ncbi:MAG: hypothetical protein AUH01_05590 [Acidobacteria bacterium 13_2_20CM_56_17]|nr:MAG: hypothetical protein AUH01_05590 [Acidobacteria bacterium 13_2_20CM_56_17]
MNAPFNISVVTIFVRHSAACKYKGEEFCRRCNCRKHLRWTAGGVQYRRSAKARTWVEAERQKQYLIEQMSAGNAPATPTVAPTIHSLVEAFVTSKQSQRIGDTTVKRHKRELTRLADFLAENGVFVPNAITAAALYKFRRDMENALPGQQYAAGSATAHPPVPALPSRRWILAEVAPVKPHQSGPTTDDAVG